MTGDLWIGCTLTSQAEYVSNANFRLALNYAIDRDHLQHAGEQRYLSPHGATR